ncbi:hypothetical protein [Rhodoblastus sp.]|uniref:hypothetical protein n=1 Tax=Rhodoblastus sp. TaxID=1962975 RepID=UPI003F9D3247
MARAPRGKIRSHHASLRFVLRGPDVAGVAWGGAPSLLNVARRDLGRGNFTGFREAWCADALRAWLRRSGYSLAGTDHRAISFARYGRPTSPHLGAIAVLRHHGGIVAGFTRGRIVLLSGNHGRRVALGAYPARRIIAFRNPV